MSSALSSAALALASAHELPSVLNHSIRTHAFALLQAEQLGLEPTVDFDSELLYVACVLHDLGASAAYDGPERFEVEGADAAAALVLKHRTPGDADLVWQAVALHTSPGLAERRGAIPMLTRLGVRTDFFTLAIPDEVRAVIEREYPRLGLDHELTGAVVEQALRQPEKARGSSWAADLVREHRNRGHDLSPDTIP